MAPNADKSRLRNRLLGDDSDKFNGATQSTVATKLKGNEIVIDGVIYDLNGFKHPGGDSIRIFGGNDVTVQYKMIHPTHTSTKHLEKMKIVGKLPSYRNDYLFDTEFEREIKREVFKIVKAGKEFGTPGYLFRAAFYITLYFVLLYNIITKGLSWPLAMAFGLSQALIGLNVQHDANHGAASKESWVNDLLGFGADMIGGCKWIWMQQHWTHHAYTNHQDLDPDSFNAEPLLLFNDYPIGHPARKFFHKYQAAFFLPILSFYWLSMVLNPEALDLEHRGSKSVGMNFENDFLKTRRKYSSFIRLIYIYSVIVCPLQFAYSEGSSLLTTVFQILTMGATESLTLALLFSLSHNFEHADRDPTKDVKTSGKSVCWFKSQVETSCTYGGFIAGALTGGLNFQVEHHLFPRMCSAYYPYIAPKVREICKKHGVRYAYYPYVWQNFFATVRYMKQAGTGSNWMTEELLSPLRGDL